MKHPRLSYCIKREKPKPKPKSDPLRTIKTVFNITDITNPTKIGGYISMCSHYSPGLPNVSTIIIDGVQINAQTLFVNNGYNSGYFYQFTKTGEHTIDYVIDETKSQYNYSTQQFEEVPITEYSITQSCFGGLSIKSIYIPDIVTVIDNYSFSSSSSLTNVTIGNSVTTIGNYAFSSCSNLTGTLTIPDSVTNIGERAFEYCRELTNVIINSGSIGDYAFMACSSITNVTLGNGVTSVGNNAFKNCYDINTVIIGTGITSMGNYVFDWCPLSSFTIQATIPPSIGSSIITAMSTTSDFKICVPSESVDAYKAANNWSDYATKIEAISTI